MSNTSLHTDLAPEIRAAIYARVSSEQQAQSQTIASQLADLEQRLAQEHLRLRPELRFVDDGYSGSTLLRPALERLRDLAAEGVIDRLYVHSPDRLARNYAYQMLLVEELRRAGVEITFLNRPLGASPEDDLLLQVQGMMAQYERAKILERGRRGRLHAAQAGKVSVLSHAPYGYRYQRGTGPEHPAQFAVDFAQAQVVRQIFTWVAQERLSVRGVCRRLQQQGLAAPKGGGHWDPSSIRGILRNPAYRGQAAYGKSHKQLRVRPVRLAARGAPEHPREPTLAMRVPASQWIGIPVPALVEEALFAAVQEQLEENRSRLRQRQREPRSLLQGLLRCGECGHAFYSKALPARDGTPGQGYRYYRCCGADGWRFGGVRRCQNRAVRSDALDQIIWQDVAALLADPQRVAREYQQRQAGSDAAQRQRQRQELLRQTEQRRQEITRLIDAYGEGLLQKQEIAPRLQRARERLAGLQGQLQQLEQPQSPEQLRLVLGHFEAFAQQVRESLSHADFATRRQIVHTLVKRVEVSKDQVRVVYRLSPDPFAEPPSGGVLPHWLRRHSAPPWVLHARK